VVEGTDFYGRKRELGSAWEKLSSEGTSLLLSAPRRVGKTSFAKKLLKLAEENGWKTLYLDLEGKGTEGEFVKFFKEELQKEKWWENARSKIGNTLLNLLDSVKGTKVAGKKLSIDTSVLRNDTYGKIKQLIENTGDIIIVLDELTVFLNHLLAQENGKEKVEFFLEWLRSFRQTTKARWILCSSVGIENFASMHQLNKHINDLYPFSLEAFSEEEAKDFISRLDVNENVQFTEGHIQYILGKLVWYLPFFIQIFIDKINFLICVKDKQLSNKTIDEAYNLLITESYFKTWSDRLKEYRGFQTEAREILNLCAFPNGRNRSDLWGNVFAKKGDREKTEGVLSMLLEMLQKDGYLTEHKGKYVFRSPLLRDFWYGHFVK